MSFYFLLKQWVRSKASSTVSSPQQRTCIHTCCVYENTKAYFVLHAQEDTLRDCLMNVFICNTEKLFSHKDEIFMHFPQLWDVRGGVLHSGFKPPVVDWCVLQLSFLSFSPSLLLYLNVLFILLPFPSSPFWLCHRVFTSLCFHLLNLFKLRGSGFSSGGVTRCAGGREYRVEPAGERQRRSGWEMSLLDCSVLVWTWTPR